MNKWSKIAVALTQKQRNGTQPAWSGIGGREGIVNTHHETCWVCEERRYVLLSWDRDNISEKWGEPVVNEKDVKRLKKKYLPGG